MSSLHLRGGSIPITAICHTSNYILTGEGSHLCIYDNKSNATARRHAIFKSQQIHGIAAYHNSDKCAWFIIWGGVLLCIARLNSDRRNASAVDSHGQPCLEILSINEVEDWILHVAFSPEAVDTKTQVPMAVLVTAHNAVFSIRFSSTLDSPLTMHQLATRSRSISYTGLVSWVGLSDVLVILGTAFGQVFVLSCSIDDPRATRIRAAFLAHDGSVFGLDLSDPLPLVPGASTSRVLITCSDDRAVRVWDLSRIPEATQSPQNGSGEPEAAEDQSTGFSNYRSVDDAHVITSTPYLASEMGHLSRIWRLHSHIPPSGACRHPTILHISSLGEDSTCQNWELEYREHSTPRLVHTGSDKFHGGRNIWSASQFIRDDRRHIVTGGADGGLAVREIRPKAQLSEDRDTSTWSEKDLAGIPSAQPSSVIEAASQSDCVRSYAFFSPHAAIACTDSGRVLMVHRKVSPSRASWEWCCLGQEGNLRGFSVASGLIGKPMEQKSEGMFILIGGPKGHIYAVEQSTQKISLIHHAQTKIAAIFTSSLRQHPLQVERRQAVILTYLQDRLPDVFILSHDGKWTSSSSLQFLPLRICSRVQTDEWSLSRVTITSAKVLSDGSRYHAVFGTREGSIITVRIDIQTPVGSSATVVPLSQDSSFIPNAHGRDAVTDLAHIAQASEPTDSRSRAIHLYSVGRDGTLTLHELVFHETATRAVKVHKLTLPFGPNIEGIHIDEEARRLFVYGFAGPRFVMFDVLEQRELLSLDCGGAHRTWSFFPALATNTTNDNGDNGLEQSVMLWTQAGNTCLRVFDDRPQDDLQLGPRSYRIKAGHHGREIKTADVVYCRETKAGSEPRPTQGNLPGFHYSQQDRIAYNVLVATGAEDTDIKIHAADRSGLVSDGAQLRCVATLKKHQTGINCLKWSRNGDRLFSSGGCEEFYVWKITPVPLLRYGICCESAYPDLTSDADLRITSFCLYEESDGSPTACTAEFTCLICMGFSDSTIKVYRYTSTLLGGSNWQKLAYSSYTSCCVMQTELLTFGDGSLILLTAGTDGHLALWDLSGVDAEPGWAHQFEPFRTIQIHQSAVKTLATKKLGIGYLLVVTGGDDNAIGITVLQSFMSQKEPYKTQVQANTALIPNAHSAAVTACLLSIMPSRWPDGSAQVDAELNPSSLDASEIAEPPTTAKSFVKAVTSSNDQKIKDWEIEIDATKDGAEAIVSVQKGEKKSTGVADVSGLNWLHNQVEVEHQTLLITGVGMEIWGRR